MVPVLILTAAVVFSVFCGSVLLSSSKRLTAEQQRASAVDPIYAPVESAEKRFKETKGRYDALKKEYSRNRSALKDAETKQSLFELGVGTTDKRLYVAVDRSESLESLQVELAKVKDKIKALKSKKKACQCEYGKDVVVNNRRSSATKLFNREIRLRLRCLDNEFKMANAIVDWNNINRLIERCESAFEEINQSGEIVKTYLRRPYLDLKIKELKLRFDINDLKFKKRETEREEKRIEREATLAEARLKADAEKVRKEREGMERLVAAEVSKINVASKEQLELIELHKKQLKKLRERESRALSMAQLTRSGYVYVISNAASFGSAICKIGMTRRLDPNVRVRELGDASVPELFDVHAFAYSDDAPGLEGFLHKTFENERVNLVNRRKEFFQVDVKKVLSAFGRYEVAIELQTEFGGDHSGQ